MANSIYNEITIQSGKYEIIAKGHIDFEELRFEDNNITRNTGAKIQSVLFDKNAYNKDKINCLIDNYDFFMQCYNGDIQIESGMACAFHTKRIFEKENWHIIFSNRGINKFNIHMQEESQTDEPFELDIVSSGTRNNSNYWIGISDAFECPLMIAEPNSFNFTIENTGDYYLLIPRDRILFFYIISKTITSFINGHEYVDLGLPSGNLWATCNIGATSPAEYGEYFAWAETKSKTSFSSRKTKYYSEFHVSYGEIYSKYWMTTKIGFADNKSRLDISDDAASVNWGGSWRIPTKDEWMELSEYCDWTSCEQDGHRGFKVSSKKNGKSIFLPKAGWIEGDHVKSDDSAGWYWSSTLLTSWEASCLEIYYDKIKPSHYHYRWHGISIRPVSSPTDINSPY